MKICPLGDVWGKQELPLFILGTPHISETNRARKLKFGTLAGICRYYGYINLPLGGVWGDQQRPLLFWDPLHISVTNGARKFKYRTHVAFMRSSALHKKLLARGRLGKSGDPTFYFGTPSYFRN